jgi:probable F420-dependent oxidoreductase
MAEGGFRFGVVAAAARGAAAWRDGARRVEELGFRTLLSPDSLLMPAPAVSLAVAASVTTRLRVGSFVLAAPLRTPRAAAWEAVSLAELTEGRFELGLGTGVPGMREQAEQIGLPYGTGGERLAQVERTIDELRALPGGDRVPVMIAAGGPKALELAGRKADIATMAAGPLATREQVDAMVARLHGSAGGRVVELSMNLFVVGDEVQPWVSRFTGVPAETLLESGSLTVLRGGPAEMADELNRRRDRFGVSYVTVHEAGAERLAPVVELLDGR